MRIFMWLQFSWQLLVNSAKFLKNNKDLLFFPIISLIAAIAFLLLTVFSGIIAIPFLVALADKSFLLGFVFLLVAYFILSFIIMYFNASLVACAVLRMQGKEASIGDGLGIAASQWWKLLQWSMVSTTVGFIVRSLENSHNFVAELVGSILGGAWTVGAYFVVPVIIFEHKGPISSLMSSFRIFGRGWKKVVSINAIFALFMFAIYGIIWLLGHLLHNDAKLLLEFSFGLAAVAFIFMATIGNAFNGVVCSALYLNIMQQQDVTGFESQLLENAFVKK